MNRTVFLITRGCYSDYRVESVWSTRAGAEAEIKRVWGDQDPKDDTGIEEFWLDGPRVDELPLWRVDLGHPWMTGNVERVELVERIGGVPDDILDPKYRGAVFVEAKDKATAIKIATERKQAAIVRLALENEEAVWDAYRKRLADLEKEIVQSDDKKELAASIRAKLSAADR